MSRTLNVGPGQTYSTNGINDQIAINKAISAANSGETVYLHAGTYVISAPIVINKNNIIFRGDGTTTLIQASSYPAFLGLGHYAMISMSSVTGDELYGFEIRGCAPQCEPENYDSNTSNDNSENAIAMESSNDNKLHDIYFTVISLDAVYADSCSNNQLYNCIMDTDFHDCADLWGCSKWHVYNCYMNTTHDSGVRFADSSDSEVSNCTITYASGEFSNGGVYFEHAVKNVTVDWNIFRDMPGIYLGAVYDRAGDNTKGNAIIHDNVFYNCKYDITNVFPGQMIYTEYNNLLPTTIATWQAQGYEYGAKISEPISAQLNVYVSKKNGCRFNRKSSGRTIYTC